MKTASNKKKIVCIRCGKANDGLLCSCGYWNVVAENKLNTAIVTLDQIEDEKVDRLDCGRWGFCFGGGIAKGTISLMGGYPGAGKSTLFLHIAAALNCKVLYLASEEKLIRIRQRADRLGIPKERQAAISAVRLTTGEVPELGEVARKHTLLMLDSVNMLTEDPSSAVAFCSTLSAMCEKFGLTCLLTSHVTKGGDIAGFEALQHVVDWTGTLITEENTRTLMVEKNRNGMAFVTQQYDMGPRGLEIIGEQGLETYDEEN